MQEAVTSVLHLFIITRMFESVSRGLWFYWHTFELFWLDWHKFELFPTFFKVIWSFKEKEISTQEMAWLPREQFKGWKICQGWQACLLLHGLVGVWDASSKWLNSCVSSCLKYCFIICWQKFCFVICSLLVEAMPTIFAVGLKNMIHALSLDVTAGVSLMALRNCVVLSLIRVATDNINSNHGWHVTLFW